MPSIAANYAIGSVFLIVLGLLARSGRLPGVSKADAQGRDLTAVSNWLFVTAGLAALLGALYLVQRHYAGEANVYTAIRLVLIVAVAAVFVRIVLLFR
jgi:uncharacterized membrane protein